MWVLTNKKTVESQRDDPSLPQRYKPRAAKTKALASTVLKKLAAKPKDSMLDPFASVHLMHPGSVIVSGEDFGDQLAHTDTSTDPHVLPPSERAPADSHPSTFVALSPKYRLNIQAVTPLGEAQVERWDGVFLNQWEVLIMVSTTRHNPPPPPDNKCRGLCSHSMPVTKNTQVLSPMPPTLTPSPTLTSSNF